VKANGAHPARPPGGEEAGRPFQAFEQFPLFRGVPQEVLLVLFVGATETVCRKGQVVVKEGDPGEELFIVGAGSVDVILGRGTPGEAVLATLKPGDCFGEMCVIEPTVRSATVVAREGTLLYGIKNTTLNKVYHFWPQQQAVIMANFALTLAERVRGVDPLFVDRAF
jgi:CRP-like cAMP-binding protein